MKHETTATNIYTYMVFHAFITGPNSSAIKFTLPYTKDGREITMDSAFGAVMDHPCDCLNLSEGYFP